MKRALVLNGGGSRGAYQIGAWQALDELGVRFSGVYGTSIGALNAALFAQGDLNGALDLWTHITLSQVITVDEEEDFSIDHMVSRKRDVIPFLLENKDRLRVDVGPLERMARARLDEARIRASGLRLGVMTFRVPQLQGHPARLEDMAPGSLVDWVMASAACFPVFPTRNIGGQRYIDGGYYDNLPVDMALADGMDEVVAVELHPDMTHPEYARMPWMTVVRPRHALGGFLDFNPRLLRRSRLMGYYDAMKRWGGLDGYLYTFKPVRALGVADGARRFMARLTRFDTEHIRRGVLYAGQPVNAPLLTALERETDGERLPWKGVWLRGAELCAQAMGFREDALYDADELIQRALAFCRERDIPPIKDDAALQALAKQGERELLAGLVQRLEAEGDFPAEWQPRLATLPMVTAAACFLSSLSQV